MIMLALLLRSDSHNLIQCCRLLNNVLAPVGVLLMYTIVQQVVKKLRAEQDAITTPITWDSIA
jgi:hypothetical protein